MKIAALTLDAVDLAPLYEFYAGDLGLPVVKRSGDVLSLQVGSTLLTFRRASRPAGATPFYHFAFNVHPARFERARATFAALTPLLHDENGQEVFDFRSWDARACYCYDPAGNIVEIIARRDLAGMPVPSEPGLLSVSEIGLVSDDVPALAERITGELGIPIYRDSSGQTFAALGDAEGLLILAQRGRIWYPETGKAAAPARVECHLDVGATPWRVEGPPYHFGKAA